MTEGVDAGIGHDVVTTTERSAGELNKAVHKGASEIVAKYRDLVTWKPGDPEIYKPIEGFTPPPAKEGDIIYGGTGLPPVDSVTELPKIVLSAHEPAESGHARWALGVYDTNDKLSQPKVRFAISTGQESTQSPSVDMSTAEGADLDAIIGKYTDYVKGFLEIRAGNGKMFAIPEELTVDAVDQIKRTDGEEDSWITNIRDVARTHLEMRDILKKAKGLHETLQDGSEKHVHAEATDAVVTKVDEIKDALMGEGGLGEKHPKMQYPLKK